MSKWLGPGVLKGEKGVVNPGDEVDKNHFKSEDRYNKLVDDGFIEGVKARKTNAGAK